MVLCLAFHKTVLLEKGCIQLLEQALTLKLAALQTRGLPPVRILLSGSYLSFVVPRRLAIRVFAAFYFFPNALSFLIALDHLDNTVLS